MSYNPEYFFRAGSSNRLLPDFQIASEPFHERFEAKGRFPLTIAFRISFKHSRKESHKRSVPRQNSVMVTALFLLIILAADWVKFF